MSTSIKDFGGVIKQVYDPDNESLQVSLVGSGTPTSPNSIRLTDGTNYLTTTTGFGYTSLDVSIKNIPVILISHDDDSIRIGDGTDLVTTTVSGSRVGLDVNLLSEGTLVNVYNEILNIVSNSLTMIASFTATQDSKLKQVSVSGDNSAIYEVVINSNVISKKRTYLCGPFNETFFFEQGLNILSGQTVSVKVKHMRPSVANFNSNLIIEVP